MRGVEEMYIPIEDDDASHREQRLTKGEKQRRHDKELAEAQEKVQAQLGHWLNFFANHQKYFAVGKVIRDDDDDDGDSELRVLCEGAQHNRPKRSELNQQL